jgi:hypothetical protein
MTISSRTPEGEPTTCPLCLANVSVEPSVLIGDATCPRCGQLLWFVQAAGTMRWLGPSHRRRSAKIQVANSVSNRPSTIERWGPRCHAALAIGIGITIAWVGVRGGPGGWFAKTIAGSLFFILGVVVTHLALDLAYRMSSLGRYLWVYGFSSKGLQVESRDDDASSSREQR